MVGETRIATDDVRAAADELAVQSPDLTREESVGASVGHLVEYAVVEELARRQDPPVSVTDAEVTARRNGLVRQAGDPAALTQAFLQVRVPASGEDQFLRSLLLREKIGARLVPGDDQATAEARAAAVQQGAQQLVEELGVRVNPRFGSWDPATFGVDPLASGGLATEGDVAEEPAVGDEPGVEPPPAG